jgi:hypothetical protein
MPKKATQPRTRLEFGAFMWLENKTARTKDKKLMVSRRSAKQPLMGAAIDKNRCRKPVSVDSRESGFTPKRCRKQRGKEKAMKNV